MTKTDEELDNLIALLSKKITESDFPQLRDASKDEAIKECDLKRLSSPKEWLTFLREKNLLSSDDPSFIEHVFEICRRPDLLTIVMEYRISNLGLQNEEELGKKLIRVRTSKKYKGSPDQPDIEQGEPAIKLSAPPKNRRKSSSTN
ncbi:astrocytic phosphoprotein PEA-15-like [Styela clava]